MRSGVEDFHVDPLTQPTRDLITGDYDVTTLRVAVARRTPPRLLFDSPDGGWQWPEVRLPDANYVPLAVLHSEADENELYTFAADVVNGTARLYRRYEGVWSYTDVAYLGGPSGGGGCNELYDMYRDLPWWYGSPYVSKPHPTLRYTADGELAAVVGWYDFLYDIAVWRDGEWTRLNALPTNWKDYRIDAATGVWVVIAEPVWNSIEEYWSTRVTLRNYTTATGWVEWSYNSQGIAYGSAEWTVITDSWVCPTDTGYVYVVYAMKRSLGAGVFTPLAAGVIVFYGGVFTDEYALPTEQLEVRFFPRSPTNETVLFARGSTDHWYVVSPSELAATDPGPGDWFGLDTVWGTDIVVAVGDEGANEWYGVYTLDPTDWTWTVLHEPFEATLPGETYVPTDWDARSGRLIGRPVLWFGEGDYYPVVYYDAVRGEWVQECWEGTSSVSQLVVFAYGGELHGLEIVSVWEPPKWYRLVLTGGGGVPRVRLQMIRDGYDVLVTQWDATESQTTIHRVVYDLSSVTQIYNGYGRCCIEPDMLEPDRLWLATPSGLLESDDRGSTWEQRTTTEATWVISDWDGVTLFASSGTYRYVGGVLTYIGASPGRIRWATSEPVEPERLLTSDGESMWFTPNYGASWMDVVPLPSGNPDRLQMLPRLEYEL